jgi:hypothetical protein
MKARFGRKRSFMKLLGCAAVLIRKALRECLDRKTLGSSGWPSLIHEWQGVPDTPPFESYRGGLPPPEITTQLADALPALSSDGLRRKSA